MKKSKSFFVLALLASVFTLAACKHDEQQAAVDPRTAPAEVRNGGMDVVFGAQSPQLQQISIDTVVRRTMTVGVSAPAHISMGVVSSESGGMPLYLFESQDVTQLYSDFVKSASTIERTTKQLERVRDLYAHKIVPQKDVIDAETEQAQTIADRGQLESRLRAAGIDAKALHAAQPGAVWVTADVPETQLAMAHVGTTATVMCNSYPGEKFSGTIKALGDVVDPITRTVKMRIDLENHNGMLRPGMFATATFQQSAANAVSVPRTAVVNVQGKSYVFTRTAAGAFHRSEVRIGAETPEAYLIVNGVEADQQVASAGVMLLKGLSFGF